MTANDYDKRLIEIRIANLRALLNKRQMTQTELAMHVGVTQAVVSQYLRLHRPLGRVFCGRVELALGLPHGGMDHENMQIPLAPMLSTSVPAMQTPAVDTAGLSSLHLAVMDTFAKTVRSGSITDEYCVELISSLLLIRASRGGGSGAE